MNNSGGMEGAIAVGWQDGMNNSGGMVGWNEQQRRDGGIGKVYFRP